MKSTDTILGAFAVMGFVLLGVFAFAGSTTDSAIDTDELDVDSQEILMVEEDESEVVELNNEDNIEVAINNDEETLDTLTNELVARNLISDLDPESIRTGVANFLQNGNPATRQEVLGAVGLADEEVVLYEGGEEVEVAVETVEVAEEVEVADTDNEETEVAAEVEIEEVEVVEPKEPGRVSKFFSNLFDKDEVNNTDEFANVGGTTEDTTNVNDNSPMVEGSYVVKSGDNLWDILKSSGMTNAQTADYINGLRADTAALNSAGITSGSVDLIFPGQVLNL